MLAMATAAAAAEASAAAAAGDPAAADATAAAGCGNPCDASPDDELLERRGRPTRQATRPAGERAVAVAAARRRFTVSRDADRHVARRRGPLWWSWRLTGEVRQPRTSDAGCDSRSARRAA